jgi:hypothetical protein
MTSTSTGPPSLGPAIETDGLLKIYNGKAAVDRVDLRVTRGGVHGFLGPNGAGKTTTIRMLATLLRPDGGSARVLGHDVVREADEVRSKVALTGQFASVDEDLTGRENLVLVARMLGYPRSAAHQRAAQLLDAFGLADAADRPVKKFSGGMRRPPRKRPSRCVAQPLDLPSRRSRPAAERAQPLGSSAAGAARPPGCLAAGAAQPLKPASPRAAADSRCEPARRWTWRPSG